MNQPLRRESIEIRTISFLTLEKIKIAQLFILTEITIPQEKKNATIKAQTMPDKQQSWWEPRQSSVICARFSKSASERVIFLALLIPLLMMLLLCRLR